MLPSPIGPPARHSAPNRRTPTRNFSPNTQRHSSRALLGTHTGLRAPLPCSLPDPTQSQPQGAAPRRLRLGVVEQDDPAGERDAQMAQQQQQHSGRYSGPGTGRSGDGRMDAHLQELQGNPQRSVTGVCVWDGGGGGLLV